ncbi:ribonucleoside diphosphate reductase small subunit [Pseudomonas phage vB_PpuM-Lauda]
MTVLTHVNPHEHEWALEKTLASNANHWLPQEIGLSTDILQWKTGQLSDDEMRMVKRNLGFFSTADSLAANNIILGTIRHIKNRNCRHYLFRQAYEEAFHTESYAYVIESLGLDQGEIFNAYNEIESIRAKDEFLLPYIEVLTDPAFQADTIENVQILLKSLFAFACIMEGLFFYVGFVQMLSLGRRNKLPGSSQEFQYILRDESGHCNFGIDLINTIKREYPGVWTTELQKECTDMLRTGVDLEQAYAVDTLPNGVLGLNAGNTRQYLEFIADRRCIQVGLPVQYNQNENPFPWMSEMVDLNNEENFFEKKVTAYQQAAGLEWD